jgi:hypothetical protein
MGLDMYLTAKKYVGDWKHDKPEERKRYRSITKAMGLDGVRCDGSPHLEVEVCVAYWRKANQIHKWFVDNCQGGTDECQKTYVEREKLLSLLNACKKVIKSAKMEKGEVKNGTTFKDGVEVPMLEDGKVVKNTKVAEQYLPTNGGFFFGSTDYDQYYIQDLEYTVEQLEAMLSNKALESFDFYYHASW